MSFPKIDACIFDMSVVGWPDDNDSKLAGLDRTASVTATTWRRVADACSIRMLYRDGLLIDSETIYTKGAPREFAR